MSRRKISPFLIPLVGYLCFFLCLLPGRIEGALLESSPAGEAATAERAVVGRMVEMGLSREEAEARVIAYRRAGLDLSGLTLWAGGDLRGVGQQKYNYDPPINNVILVFLICAAGAGAAALAAGAAK